MKISVEVSMYPLSENYIPSIVGFIESLKEVSDVIVRTNGMSTQVFGEYDIVMHLLHQKIKEAMHTEPKVVFVSKILSTDVSSYPRE